MPHEIEEQLNREGVDIFADGGAPQGPEALGPMTEEEAERYLRERNHLEHEIATIKAQAEAKLSPVRSALHQLNWLHEHRLEQFVRAQAEATGKKTFPFWNGTCRLRSVKGRPIIEDDGVAFEYAAEQSNFSVLALNASEYKKLAQTKLALEGEVIPGVNWEPDRVSFSVQFKANNTAESEEE